jgi:hypothetical protein
VLPFSDKPVACRCVGKARVTGSLDLIDDVEPYRSSSWYINAPPLCIPRRDSVRMHEGPPRGLPASHRPGSSPAASCDCSGTRRKGRWPHGSQGPGRRCVLLLFHGLPATERTPLKACPSP